MKKFIAIGLTLLAIGCGKNSNFLPQAHVLPGKIVGGEKIKEENLFTKHTVGIVNHHKNTICTASIIESDLILTAAHCVDQAPTERIEIVFGPSLSASAENRITAKSIYVHENYINQDNKIDNDIALIRLKKTIPKGYEALDLEAGRSLHLNQGEKITALGYGVVRTGSLFSGKGSLRMASIALKSYDVDAQLVVLDQSKGAGICFGDSGGPSFTVHNGRAVQVGITSYVSYSELKSKREKCLEVGALSNPNYFYSWIQDSKLKI